MEKLVGVWVGKYSCRLPEGSLLSLTGLSSETLREPCSLQTLQLLINVYLQNITTKGSFAFSKEENVFDAVTVFIIPTAVIQLYSRRSLQTERKHV